MTSIHLPQEWHVAASSTPRQLYPRLASSTRVSEARRGGKCNHITHNEFPGTKSYFNSNNKRWTWLKWLMATRLLLNLIQNSTGHIWGCSHQTVDDSSGLIWDLLLTTHETLVKLTFPSLSILLCKMGRIAVLDGM